MPCLCVSETTSTDAVLARAPSARHAVSQISCNAAHTVSETTSTDAVLARAPSARHAVSQISCNVARTVSETTSTDAVLARAPSARHAVSQISCNVAHTVSETTSTDAVLTRAPSARHAVSQISCNVARTPFQRLTAVSIATFLLPRHDPPPLPSLPSSPMHSNIIQHPILPLRRQQKRVRSKAAPWQERWEEGRANETGVQTAETPVNLQPAAECVLRDSRDALDRLRVELAVLLYELVRAGPPPPHLRLQGAALGVGGVALRLHVTPERLHHLQLCARPAPHLWHVATTVY